MSIYLLLKEVKYTIFAKHKKGHGIHSPFVFNLIEQSFQKKTEAEILTKIEQIRKTLQKSNTLVKTQSLGSSSKLHSKEKIKTSRLVFFESIPKKYGLLLFNLVSAYKPKIIVELGTGIGLSSLYLAAANPEGSLISFEGNEEKIGIAKEISSKLQLTNIKYIAGNIDLEFEQYLKKVKLVDFLFVDANHTYLAMKNYFNLVLKSINNDSIVVFDDIHWSKEMETAWNEIYTHPSVTVSIDLFRFGIVFFRKESKKQHFVIKF